MTVTPRLKISWSVVNLLVLLYALVPVLWIASLCQFNRPDDTRPGKFIRRMWLETRQEFFETPAPSPVL